MKECVVYLSCCLNVKHFIILIDFIWNGWFKIMCAKSNLFKTCTLGLYCCVHFHIYSLLHFKWLHIVPPFQTFSIRNHNTPGGSFTKMFIRRVHTSGSCVPMQLTTRGVMLYKAIWGFYDGLTGRTTHHRALWKTPHLS